MSVFEKNRQTDKVSCRGASLLKMFNQKSQIYLPSNRSILAGITLLRHNSFPTSRGWTKISFYLIDVMIIYSHLTGKFYFTEGYPRWFVLKSKDLRISLGKSKSDSKNIYSLQCSVMQSERNRLYGDVVLDTVSTCI